MFQLQAVYARLQLWSSRSSALPTRWADSGSNPTVIPSLIYPEPDMADRLHIVTLTGHSTIFNSRTSNIIDDYLPRRTHG